MGSLAKSHLDCNASVELGYTEFTATGRPDSVTHFLTNVCDGLSALPVQRLATEARVLQVEGAPTEHPMAATLLWTRYGARDLGLAGSDEPRLGSLTAEEVQEWAGRYFRRGNAAMWLTGAPPAQLRLPLPGGTRPPRDSASRLPLSLPAWTSSAIPAVGLGFEGPRESQELLSGVRVAIDRATDVLRHERGLSYYIDFFANAVDYDVGHVSVVADVQDKEAGQAAQLLWQVFSELAQKGPTEAELEHDRAGAAEHFADPRSIAEELVAAARAHLAGLPPRSFEGQLAEMQAVTSKGVAAALKAALPSALIIVPDEEPLSLEGFSRVPESSLREVTGRTFARRFRSGAPRGTRMILGEDGVSLVLPDGARWTVLFQDCIGAARQPDGTTLLLGVDGWSVPVNAADWRDGEELVRRVEQRLPAGVLFEETRSADGERRTR